MCAVCGRSSSTISAAGITTCREDLRAQLISIGIWMMKEIERLRTGATASFADLIEINAIIRDGLA